MSAFDRTLIYGVTALACAMGLSVATMPALFLPLLTVHIWAFGYDHVISTFTRLAGTPEDRARHRFLIWVLPPIVLLVVTGASWTIGVVGLNTAYFFFQWFHTTRQSWGLARHYREPIPQWAFWSVPVTGLLHRCAQQPTSFLYMDLWLPPVPEWLVTCGAFMSMICVLRYIRPYLVTHFFVFAMAYLAIDDLHAGWLLVNVWHNVQYLVFVWWKNRERFSAGVRSDARWLSWLSQPGPSRALLYFGVCFLISLPTLGGLYALGDVFAVTLLLALAVNFHHYIVDSIIWRSQPKVG